MDTGIHVYPTAERSMHDFDPENECRCGTKVEYIAWDTGLPYEEGPRVVHDKLTDTPDGPGAWSIEVFG